MYHRIVLAEEVQLHLRGLQLEAVTFLITHRKIDLLTNHQWLRQVVDQESLPQEYQTIAETPVTIAQMWVEIGSSLQLCKRQGIELDQDKLTIESVQRLPTAQPLSIEPVAATKARVRVNQELAIVFTVLQAVCDSLGLTI